MFLVTNREPTKKSGGPEILGKKPNSEGPNELRIVEAVKRGGKWKLTVLDDHVTKKMQAEVEAPDNHVVNYVAGKILMRVNPKARTPPSRAKGRNLLVFVHGFKNDVEDVLERSAKLARNYGVEVLPFTWPANGGGMLSGTASYKSDKRDAKVSTGALDRVLLEVGRRMSMLASKQMATIERKAERFHDNEEQRAEYIARACEQECPITVNFMTHSMGTYLYKHVLLSTASEGKGLIFDNVVLAAADTNNEDHARWVDQIRARRRVYITINEDDKALQVSRVKTGEEQRARLGHYPFNLYSRHAAYVQFTDAAKVDDSHAYFEGKPIENPKVKRFFRMVLNGQRGDKYLSYDDASNTYRL